MLTADTLTALADAAEHLSNLRAGAGCPFSERQPLDIVASDARREAQTANGLSTAATLHWCMTVDNDRRLAERLRDIIAEHRPNYGDVSDLTVHEIARKVEECDALARVGLADALRDWSEIMAGTEGVAGFVGSSELRGDMDGGYDLSPFTLTMIRQGLAAIDWHALARHYADTEETPC